MGYYPHPVTVFFRGHIKGLYICIYRYVYNYIMNLVQLLESGGSTQFIGAKSPSLTVLIRDNLLPDASGVSGFNEFGNRGHGTSDG